MRKIKIAVFIFVFLFAFLFFKQEAFAACQVLTDPPTIFDNSPQATFTVGYGGLDPGEKYKIEFICGLIHHWSGELNPVNNYVSYTKSGGSCEFDAGDHTLKLHRATGGELCEGSYKVEKVSLKICTSWQIIPSDPNVTKIDVNTEIKFRVTIDADAAKRGNYDLSTLGFDLYKGQQKIKADIKIAGAGPGGSIEQPIGKLGEGNYKVVLTARDLSTRLSKSMCESPSFGVSLPGQAPPAGFGPTRCDPKTGKEVPGGDGIATALGCIPVINTTDFAAWILKFAIGIGGGIAFLLMLFGVFQIITSAGDPERLKAGQELITSALIGLLMIIFSIFLLQLIGVQILQIFK